MGARVLEEPKELHRNEWNLAFVNAYRVTTRAFLGTSSSDQTVRRPHFNSCGHHQSHTWRQVSYLLKKAKECLVPL